MRRHGHKNGFARPRAINAHTELGRLGLVGPQRLGALGEVVAERLGEGDLLGGLERLVRGR